MQEPIVPKPVIDEFRRGLQDLKAAGRFGKTRATEALRVLAFSRVSTANGQRWINAHREEVVSALDAVVSEVASETNNK